MTATWTGSTAYAVTPETFADLVDLVVQKTRAL
jgi:hypothetical protein